MTKNLFLLTATLLLVFSTQLFSQDFNRKLSFETHIFLKKYEQTKTDTVNQTARKNSLRNYSFQSKNDVSFTKLYIKINDVNVDKNFIQEKLENLDAKVLVKTKSVILISIPINKINELAELDFVKFIDISTQPEPLLDRALPSSNVDKVHQGFNLERSYFGEGVIVGIVDHGFDFTHPMFLDENGNSRVVRAWLVADESGTPPANSDVGTLYTNPTVIQNTVQFSSKNGNHGTHCIGIAAGSEVEGIKNTYSGVASKADIAIVDRGFGEFVSFDIAEGLAYLFDYADSVGKPIVVNMSLGSVGHPNDGFGPRDLMISELLQENPEGRILVASAGNSGSTKMHFEYEFLFPTQVRMNLQPQWNRLGTNKGAYFSAMGGVGDNFRITVQVYDENWDMPLTQPFHILTSDNTVINEIDTYYQMYLYATDEFINGKPLIIARVIDLMPSNDYEHTVRVTLTRIGVSENPIHCWNDGGGELKMISPQGLNADSRHTVGSPGTIEEVITVGAYVTRDTIVSYTNIISPNFGPKNAIAQFSSRGPLTNGKIKPDIIAPGSALYAAHNSFDTSWTDANLARLIADKTQDQNHEIIALQGTSMSAPMVAGIVALMLEINPKLTQAEIKDIIRITAINDEWTGDAINNKCPTWGWGKINAHGIMQHLDPSSISDFFNEISFTVFPNPTVNNEITISINDTVCDLPFVVNIFDETGKLVYLSSMQNEKTFDISKLASGFYIVKIDNSKRSSVQKIVVGR